MPNSWLVAYDALEHGVVILVLGHRSETEAGFALTPDDAKKMAAGLIKNAELVVASKAVDNHAGEGS